MGFLKSIASWMGSGFSVFVYVAIVVLFIVGIFRCILPVSRNASMLQRAVKSIKKGDKARRSWQEDKFLGKGSLHAHWSEYLTNLFFADGEYHNPSNVEDFINEETVIQGPGRSHLSDALPGVQVSLGFLGTLLGLSVALSSMNASDAAQITDSMTTLLSSMKYAFLTSIFGVVASVTFTLLTRIVHGKAERALLEFYNAMSRYAGVLSVDPMTQIAIYQQEQTGILKEMRGFLDEEHLSKLLSPVMERVAQTVDMTCEAQQQLMNTVADAYIDKMNRALSGQFDELERTIRNTCSYQEKTMHAVSEALSGVTETSRAMKEIRDTAFEVLNKYDRALTQMSDAIDAFGKAQDRMRVNQNAQTECLQALTEAKEQLAARTADLVQITDEFTRRSSASLTGASKALTDSGEALAGVMGTAREQLQRDMTESLDYFDGVMTQIIKRIDKAARQVKESTDALPKALNEATGAYLDELTALTNALSEKRRRM